MQNITTATADRQPGETPIDEIMKGIANAQADDYGVNRPFPDCSLVGCARGLTAYNEGKALVRERGMA